MPHFKCGKCQHEYDSSKPRICDWCGNENPRVLEEETSFEKFVKEIKWLKVFSQHS